MARTRKWGECGSEEKLLWLAFLPFPISIATVTTFEFQDNMFLILYSSLSYGYGQQKIRNCLIPWSTTLISFFPFFYTVFLFFYLFYCCVNTYFRFLSFLSILIFSYYSFLPWVIWYRNHFQNGGSTGNWKINYKNKILSFILRMLENKTVIIHSNNISWCYLYYSVKVQRRFQWQNFLLVQRFQDCPCHQYYNSEVEELV